MKKYLLVIFIGALSCSRFGVLASPDLASPEAKQEDSSVDQGFKDTTFSIKETFDPEKKRQDVVALLKRGSDFLEKHSLQELLWKINGTSEFYFGELSLFVDEFNGTSLGNRNVSILWQNFLQEQDVFGTYYIKKMIDRAQKGGGWVTYAWQGASKVSLVKMIQKDGKKCVLGCGFYPHTRDDAVVALVRGAVSTFYRYVDRGASVEDAFSDFSFAAGKFVFGDLYVFVLDKDLVIRANGRDPGEIGVSYWDIQNEKGEYFLREIPEVLANASLGQGHWFDYEFYNAPMRTYVERVVDKEGNPYFIACGYHPYADREEAVKLIDKGFAALKKEGLASLARTINDWSNREFVYGRMALFIYAADGEVIADGARPTLTGKNLLDEKDESGYAYVRMILEQAKKDTGFWSSFRLRNAVCSAYCKGFTFEGKRYVIGTTFYSLSKESAMVLLVKSACGFLEAETEAKAFRAFGEMGGKYVLGDLMVFVYGLDGTCYADGVDVANVWRNMLNEKDDEGRPYVKIMINSGRTKPAKVIFKKYGARMVAYVEPVKKGNKTYIVVSGYYI